MLRDWGFWFLMLLLLLGLFCFRFLINKQDTNFSGPDNDWSHIRRNGRNFSRSRQPLAASLLSGWRHWGERCHFRWRQTQGRQEEKGYSGRCRETRHLPGFMETVLRTIQVILVCVCATTLYSTSYPSTSWSTCLWMSASSFRYEAGMERRGVSVCVCVCGGGGGASCSCWYCVCRGCCHDANGRMDHS